MATVYEDQLRLAKDEDMNQAEYRRLVRRSMWISIFLGVTVSVALLAYALTTQQIVEDDLPRSSFDTGLAFADKIVNWPINRPVNSPKEGFYVL